MTSALIVIGAVTLTLPVYACLSVLLLQAVAACSIRRESAELSTDHTPSFVVLMPAHNEESIIAQHVSSVRKAIGTKGWLLVVADNCTDATASSASAAGAQVIQRNEPTHRGKGYALAFGLDHLRSRPPPEIVIVLDADCQVSGDALEHLARAAHQLQRPVQGQYDMLAPPGSPLSMRMAAFAWDFRGRFRAHGYLNMGLPCQLMGSGMAFPWQIISRVDLATGHLVEDMKLGLDCARLGFAPALLPSALVTSEFPSNEAGAQSQRKRWEHGHLGMVASSAPPLLAEAVRNRNIPLLAMTIDMCVPPLAFLSLLVFSHALLTASLTLTGLAPVWVGALGFTGLAVLLAIVIAGWWRVGRRWVSVPELATVPWYVLRKLPVYAGFFLRRQAQWIRTRRD